MNLLEQFFGEVGAQEFLRNCWPGEVQVQDGELARLGALATVPEFYDVELLLQNVRTPVDLVHSDGKRVIVQNPMLALPSYRNGAAMLYLKDLEVFPAVANACNDLANLLSIPRQHVSCEGFAAACAVNVPLHFDHETNFMVQIRGDKTWKYVENTDLPEPIFPYFPSNPNRFYDNGRNPFTHLQLPRECPDGYVERVVHAGTVTFMPRGVWHQTRTHAESFAIGFVIDPPTLAEIVVASLLAVLHADQEFRAHPLTVNTPEGRTQVAERIERLQRAAAESVTALKPATLIDDYLMPRLVNKRTLLHPR